VGAAAYVALRERPQAAGASVQATDSTSAQPPHTSAPEVSQRPAEDSAARPAPTPPATDTGAASTAVATTPTGTPPAARPSEPPPRPAGDAAPVARRIEIRPAKPGVITQGGSIALAVTVLDAAGTAINAPTVAWATSDARVASVDPARGVVHGVGVGAARITARSAGAAAGVTVTVLGRSADSVVTGDASRARGATGSDAAGGAPPNGAAPPTSTPAAAPKSDAQLRGEIQAVLGAYARAIEQRDTALIRRVFPNAGYELLTRWQTTFDDARGGIAMNDADIEIVDTPHDVPGAQVHVRAKYSARFSSRAARSDQTFPVVFTAVLQRDGGAWRITSIR